MEEEEPYVDHCMCRSASGTSGWYCEEDAYFDSHEFDECDFDFCYWGFKNGSLCLDDNPPELPYFEHDHEDDFDHSFGQDRFDLKPEDFVWKDGLNSWAIVDASDEIPKDAFIADA